MTLRVAIRRSELIDKTREGRGRSTKPTPQPPGERSACSRPTRTCARGRSLRGLEEKAMSGGRARSSAIVARSRIKKRRAAARRLKCVRSLYWTARRQPIASAISPISGLRASSPGTPMVRSRQIDPANGGRVIITGTGRAGTTFLVQLFTALGFDTGFTREEALRLVDGVSLSGLERSLFRPENPYIIKSPLFADHLRRALAEDKIRISLAIIPVRNLIDAAASRRRVYFEAGKIRSDPQNHPGSLWHTLDALPPGGGAGDQVPRADRYAGRLSRPHGLSVFPENGGRRELLLRRAGRVLERARRRRRGVRARSPRDVQSGARSSIPLSRGGRLKRQSRWKSGAGAAFHKIGRRDKTLHAPHAFMIAAQASRTSERASPTAASKAWKLGKPVAAAIWRLTPATAQRDRRAPRSRGA